MDEKYLGKDDTKVNIPAVAQNTVVGHWHPSKRAAVKDTCKIFPL
jgi:hypothetical protein